MATAVISDIHSNLEALQAVLADIDARGVEKIICMGDIIGYGPNPRECLDLVQERCEFALMGNHDFASLYEPTSFNATAESAAFWTRRQLETDPDIEAQKKRWQFLGSLKVRTYYEEALCVHASPRKPINEYLFPDDVLSSPNKMDEIFSCIKWRGFCGHTHVPGVFTNEPDFYGPDELGESYKFSESEKCIINPGSVGQPRDRDPRASYAIVYEDRVEFTRVEYDVEAVAQKVANIPDLHDFLGQRLIEGR